MIYDAVNKGKSNFDAVYNSDTPSLYFQTMRSHDYQIPEASSGTTRQILSHLISSVGGREINILYLGCSYGVNASVLKYGMCLSDLFGRYVAKLDRDTLVRRDREFYASSEAWPEVYFVGFDSAGEAVRYAKECGVISDGFCANFERPYDGGGITEAHAGRTRSIDLILSTGCVGYIAERTFDGILALTQPSPPKMIASYVLRMFDYTPIAECLFRRGYSTARLTDQQFKQRRCANDEEHGFVLSQIRARGFDPVEAEIGGYLCADL